MRKLMLAGLMGLVGLLGGTGRAEAELVFSIQQAGADVVVTASGSLYTTGLTGLTGSDVVVGMIPIGPAISAGSPPGGPDEAYFVFITGPASFGTGAYTAPTSGSGDYVLLNGLGSNFIGTPVGYISGAMLSSSDTYVNQTFATLGLTPGTYVYSYSATQGGTTLDTITVQVGPATSVAEPSSLALLGIACGAGLGYARSRRRRLVA